MISLIFFLTFLRIDLVVGVINAEDRLFRKLFIESEYDSKVRPVLDARKPVIISFRYDFMQLFEVNEKSQTVCILSLTYQNWYDHRLFWNASEYDGITDLAISNALIWTPDTTLYNGADLYRPNTEDIQKAIITIDPNMSAGLITYFYNTKHTIGCSFDMRYFPFDTQNCTFIFGSWTHDVRMIDYTLTKTFATMETFTQNSAWMILSFNMTPNSFYYECCPFPYTLINANLVIKRRPLYYVFNLVIPTIVINILSTFSLFASQGSPDNLHDKLQIGISALLSYCILLLSVSDQIPHGSASVPLLGIIYVIIMIQNAIELFAAVYLCYPKRRKNIMHMLTRQSQQVSEDVSKINSVDTKQSMKLAVNHAIDNQKESIDNYGLRPEITCFILSLASTFCIAAVFFAIGFSS